MNDSMAFHSFKKNYIIFIFILEKTFFTIKLLFCNDTSKSTWVGENNIAQQG